MDSSQIVLFGPFTFDRARLILTREGRPVPVGGRGAALLATLVEAEGEVVTRAELLNAAWPGQVVEERNLTVQIATLRKAMGEMPEGQNPIRTVSRVGYRLLLDAPPPAIEAFPSVRPSVAVLPFANLSPDPELSYFADGMTEDLITALSRFKSFAVVARSSSFAFKDSAVSVHEIARILGVRYLVEGSVRRSGKRMRVSARLSDAASDTQLWGETFDGALGDVFDMQDRITEAAVGLVEPHITEAEIERSRRKHPESLDAYDHFLRGLWLLPQEDDVVDDCIAHFDRAVELDPAFPQALAFASWAHDIRQTFGLRTPPGVDDNALSIALADRALAVAGSDALVLAMVGHMYFVLKDDSEAALALVERAVSLNPNGELILNMAATVHMQPGHYGRAIELYERALQLSPGGTYNYWALQGIAEAHLNCGRYEEAITYAKRSLATPHQFKFAVIMLVIANGLLGRVDEARSALDHYRTAWSWPGLTIKSLLETMPTGARRRAERGWIEGLRKAGLPEG